jgi:hypothetical protein
VNEDPRHGNLAVTPLPRVFFRLWEGKESGPLRIRGQEGEHSLYFLRGDLALAQGFFSEENFRRRLTAARLLGYAQVEECTKYARESRVSLPRALIERGLLPPRRVWESLTESWTEEVLLLFDLAQADYVFESGPSLPEADIFLVASTLELILRGLRQTRNSRLIEASLPAEDEGLEVIPAGHAGTLNFEAHERYVLNLIPSAPRPQDLYSRSQLGKRETQRVIFTLIELGLAGVSRPATKVKAPAGLSSAGLEKIWNDFNDRCSYIFKYTSKEIGPVAVSVLEKALDEVKARLGPPLQGLELRTDGRIEFRPFPLMSLNLETEESLKNFIRVLNEILAAEVLAIKKTLGNAHEAAVIRNLEKMGESA